MILLLTTALAGLQPGMTVRLPPGRQGPIVIKGQSFDPPVTIDASNAIVVGLEISNSSGIIWRGGRMEAPRGRGDADTSREGRGRGKPYNAVIVDRSRNITFDNVTFTNAKNAMVTGRTNGLTIRNSRFEGMRSDGIDSVGNNNVLIENNRFSGTVPIRATGSRTEGNFIDGDHPDAIQFWTPKEGGVASDIIVRNNIIEGATQGINTFGKDSDAFSRITIEKNRVDISYPAAISLINCDDCTIRDNIVTSNSDARHKANVRSDKSTGTFCGNTVRMIPKHKANARCGKP